MIVIQTKMIVIQEIVILIWKKVYLGISHVGITWAIGCAAVIGKQHDHEWASVPSFSGFLIFL